jgi:hypothetical protein
MSRSWSRPRQNSHCPTVLVTVMYTTDVMVMVTVAVAVTGAVTVTVTVTVVSGS